LKYKLKSVLKTVELDITPKVTSKIADLWAAYIHYKASGVKETTQLYHESFRRLFERLGDVQLPDAWAVKAALERITTVH
jgi:hypothetical protein